MSDETITGSEEAERENEDSPVKGTTGEKKRHGLTEAQYAEIRERYELGKDRMSDLADEFGVSRQALQKRFKADGVTYGSRAHEIAAATGAAIKKVVAAETERYAEKRLDWIEEVRTGGYNDIKRARLIANKIVADSLKAAKPLSSVDADLKAHGRYVNSITKLIEMQLRVLEADNVISEDDLPTLRIEDLTINKILDHHRLNGVDDADELDEILKSFAGELDDAGGEGS